MEWERLYESANVQNNSLHVSENTTDSQVVDGQAI